MANSLLNTRPSYRRRISRTHLRPKFQLGSVTLTFLTVLIVFVLSLVYLTHTNRITTKGYEIKDLEEKRAELLSENEKLNVAIAKHRALAEIEKHIAVQSMVPVGNELYATGQKLNLR